MRYGNSSDRQVALRRLMQDQPKVAVKVETLTETPSLGYEAILIIAGLAIAVYEILNNVFA